MEKIRRPHADIAPAGPTYARAVRAGDVLYISGCTARGTPAEGGSALEQLKVTLERVVRIVQAEGGEATDIVKCTTFVTKISDWYLVSEEQIAVYDGYFHGEDPANSLVGITALALPGLDIEIEAVAVLS
ncbi:MAG TPA: enamine deaminase RidA [Dehalococcoidia bacterium]|jgi:2-iminobutanoate/2-iminopropanoate deaminase|nr:RidA family protein [SAR202 cluster bacterium]MDP6662986.1 RidA family protein [SAR202 cluster bacterium]MDP6798887.1 RidA family protein [SAR202 cluster bacterium]MQG59058.1 RidA family protein [SAR202 cluster bacterium]HAL47590.1 enamine deaminase RidA [Dehalococcoidia bacterium]|tara:strand:+ start:13124 stop:13513 length:390 start_codon:yes stop_codon:yes gene_type:complete